MDFNLYDVITLDRSLVLLEVAVIGVAAFFAYKVGKKQNQINENILGLHLAPRLFITIDLSKEKIYITNSGSNTVDLWRLTGKGIEDKRIEEPLTIQPNTNINLKMAKLFEIARTRNDSFVESIVIYISSTDGKKFKLKTTIHFDIKHGELMEVRAQNHPLEEWSE